MNRIEAAKLAREAKAANTPPMPDRFWLKVDVRGPEECWEWKAAYRNATHTHKYGAFWMNGRHHPANKIAWEIANGPMPEGMFACHSCDNPGCCNPRHIFPGTTQENTADKMSKGRHPQGEAVHNARLKKQDIIEIRARKPVGRKAPIGLRDEIASKYGITKHYVTEIWAGKSWRVV